LGGGGLLVSMISPQVAASFSVSSLCWVAFTISAETMIAPAQTCAGARVGVNANAAAMNNAKILVFIFPPQQLI